MTAMLFDNKVESGAGHGDLLGTRPRRQIEHHGLNERVIDVPRWQRRLADIASRHPTDLAATNLRFVRDVIMTLDDAGHDTSDLRIFADEDDAIEVRRRTNRQVLTVRVSALGAESITFDVDAGTATILGGLTVRSAAFILRHPA